MRGVAGPDETLLRLTGVALALFGRLCLPRLPLFTLANHPLLKHTHAHTNVRSHTRNINSHINMCIHSARASATQHTHTHTYTYTHATSPPPSFSRRFVFGQHQRIAYADAAFESALGKYDRVRTTDLEIDIGDDFDTFIADELRFAPGFGGGGGLGWVVGGEGGWVG